MQTPESNDLLTHGVCSLLDTLTFSTFLFISLDFSISEITPNWLLLLDSSITLRKWTVRAGTLLSRQSACEAIMKTLVQTLSKSWHASPRERQAETGRFLLTKPLPV